MSLYAKRRGWGRVRNPRPSDDDLGVWRRFLKHAGKIARKPDGNVGSFVRAAEKAGKVVLPVGHQRSDSPFVQLVRMGTGFYRLTPAARAEASAPMTALVAECLAVLGDVPAEARPAASPAPSAPPPLAAGRMPYRED